MVLIKRPGNAFVRVTVGALVLFHPGKPWEKIGVATMNQRRLKVFDAQACLRISR